MKTIRVSEDCVKDVPVRRRPYGYLFICCDNLDEHNYLYWGEVQVRFENTRSLFRYTIDFLDMRKKYYRLRIFRDREFRNLVVEAHIQFNDSRTRDLKIHKADGHEFVPDELFSLMHIVVYERIIEQIIPLIQHQILHVSPQKPIGGQSTVFGFRKHFIEDFFQETFVKFETFVSNINLLFG